MYQARDIGEIQGLNSVPDVSAFLEKKMHFERCWFMLLLTLQLTESAYSVTVRLVVQLQAKFETLRAALVSNLTRTLMARPNARFRGIGHASCFCLKGSSEPAGGTF
jgi:hypothetical protein